MPKTKKQTNVKLSPYKREYIVKNEDLILFTIDNFIKEEECDYLCTLVQKTSTRSTVAGYGNNVSVESDGRTSSSSTIQNEDPIAKIINERMSKELEIPIENGEVLQGQIYQVGQEFRNHTDYFTGDSYINHCLHSGQRTWTVMAYLNDVEEGGETEFELLNKKITPKKGMAVIWKNADSTGKEFHKSLHAGRPVKKGKKIIITKWYRENECDVNKDLVLANEYHQNKKKELDLTNQSSTEISNFINEKNNIVIINSLKDLPRLTKYGFKVTKVPPKTWRLIQETYNFLQGYRQKEDWQGIEEFIHDKQNNKVNVEMLNMDICPRIKEIIQSELKPMHDAFIDYREEIEPVWIYGIRSYTNGSILKAHTDVPATHHISSIVIVDKKVEEDWPLQIRAHDGTWHEIYTNPGDVILYESAICMHGRETPFKGEFYRNFFTHFKLKRYKVEL